MARIRKSVTMEGSCFMTPNSASGKAVYAKPSILAPIPLTFSTPSPPPLCQSHHSEEHLDVLGSLIDYGIPIVAKMILSSLSEKDLIRYVELIYVKSWMFICNELTYPETYPVYY